MRTRKLLPAVLTGTLTAGVLSLLGSEAEAAPGVRRAPAAPVTSTVTCTGTCTGAMAADGRFGRPPAPCPGASPTR
ncbi:hypothetical protein [Streptomyces yaizuensis]|uniref:Secreted protein n=1 Tax=Streptomyces yaizuensis TaxID=2989713 RepID=A0ABQ5NSX3_9ACTN|nr:hypothetical protein [Streptomyces sp. YSPA8]GLF93111.1 hypothetical protein SYYSPA8_02460 [Streptomyces sp. YSPA8]